MTITNAQYLSLILEVSECNMSIHELLAIINVTQDQYTILLNACENSLRDDKPL